MKVVSSQNIISAVNKVYLMHRFLLPEQEASVSGRRHTADNQSEPAWGALTGLFLKI